MKVLKVINSSVFQIISVLFVAGYLLGVLNLHFSDKNNYCVMTYMFEFPQFVEISVPENIDNPQYGLYAYSEGRLTEMTRKMWFNGVPVLFLPGNSGSHMQARSLASVALRKALARDYDYHFDFFTIKYNEELSGLFGGVLQRQTEYASACITKILSLYKSNKYTKMVPTSVILIGHSMGGVIAKRLLAYPSTLNTTSIAITLAAPLQAPVINFDMEMNHYYLRMNMEWEANITVDENMRDKKLLLSFGSGPRDVLIPSWLTTSNESDIGALTTSVPGVWVSTDHVSIVWCKQLVMAINRYLFSIVEPHTKQIKVEKNELKKMAKHFFKANRSMFLSPDIVRPDVTMLMDAFWYEDNRRIYQVSRPEIEKTTYLMIRLVTFPQNRFVAVEAVNVDDKDWIFGCSAKYTHNTYRYCKQATSLAELSRWTGAATNFGKRKLATVHLHRLKDDFPDWTHVVVKVSPTRKPVVLNVDINDHASRQITVSLPSYFSFGKSVIKAETEKDSLYYELILTNFNVIHEAYLLYVEPTANCKAIQYHVSAELSVPWGQNQEYYHYFTQSKLSPMKLRLFMSNPNVTLGLEAQEHPKITLLLDPQCTFTISISTSWYHRLGQMVRYYTPVLLPYMAAIVLLAARSNILHVIEHGSCQSIHMALMSEGVKPYYALVYARLATMALVAIPFLSFITETASHNNQELQYFVRSLVVLPTYMTALGLLNIAAAATVIVMVFSSQLAHRLLFRIVWRGGSGLAERVASALQKIPVLVSIVLVSAAPLSCGAASMMAGAAFYAFMLSKMYEEYLEDYAYKLMAKVASRICRMFKSKKTVSTNNESESSLIKTSSNDDVSTDIKAIEDNKEKSEKRDEISQIKDSSNNDNEKTESEKAIVVNSVEKGQGESVPKCDEIEDKKIEAEEIIDDNLNNLNFHMMLFFMWIVVTIVNLPVLMTWARNFKYSMELKPDTSLHTGMALASCSSFIWQMEGPRKNLKNYEAMAHALFTMAVCILVLGPFSLTFVNYGVTFMVILITVQQMFDSEDKPPGEETDIEDAPNDANAEQKNEINSDKNETEENVNSKPNAKDKDDENAPSEENNKKKGLNANDDASTSDDCDVCNESRIYNVFKNLREKFSFNDEL
ncbi:GPI inositol-deacylase [Amyelois transitella]|uniref:GPI inositol-deacylase n=1 Tax=Amyelois transitella TaxID=680683 RepID=UPI00067B3653|nr:GPI inositol-deacylase [Amyelois transitella]